MIERNRTRIPLRRKVPATYMRGGSSKAVFFHEKDIPPPGEERDAMLKRVMGSPDPLQIDGMGGSKAVTSKIAIINPSTREDADIDYTFGQVSVTTDAVGYTGNCGNVSAAVGPFAIEEGLVEEVREGPSIDPTIKTQTVRIYNTNTKKIILSHVPVDDSGAPLEKGDFAMAAVPGTGAPIMMDYVGTMGARMHKGILPTGNVIDTINVKGKDVRITIGDVANPIIFFDAKDVGMTGYESASELSDNKDLLATINELRGKATELVGLCDDWTKVDEQSPFIPMPCAIASPKDGEGDVSGRLFLDHMCHESMAGSGAICTTACSRVPGSIVNEHLRKGALQETTLHISHPVGIMPVEVKTKQNMESSTEMPEFETLSFVRTARRIMEGTLLLPHH